jgi:thiamine kinase-like enzyme
MSSISGADGVRTDQAVLRDTVERLLARAWGEPVKIVAFSLEPSLFATLFPADVLSVQLEGGRQLSLFVKYLGLEQADHPDKQCRDREIRVYEQLLGADRLPVPRYYGSCWNPVTARYELFLEHVDDWNLKYHELSHWFTAARRLAHFHAYFARQAETLYACEFLLRLDARYFNEWARRAQAAVAAQAADLSAELGQVVDNYHHVSEVLCKQPVTLVHNDLSPKNVLADRAHHPARICFVDWEMAGVGCGLLDLVHLKHGLDPVSDQQMCAAYCAELAGTPLLAANSQDVRQALAACALHQTLYRLAFSQTWLLPLETVRQWVLEARQFFAQL